MALCKGCLETTSSLLAIYYANFHVGLKCFGPIDYVAHIEVNYRFLHQSHMLNFFLNIIFFYFRCIGDIISNIHSTRPHNFQLDWIWCGIMKNVSYMEGRCFLLVTGRWFRFCLEKNLPLPCNSELTFDKVTTLETCETICYRPICCMWRIWLSYYT